MKLTNLIQRIAMGANQLVAILRERQVAYLTPRIDTIDPRSRQTVPKSNASIRRTPTARQQAMLVRRPRYRLHRRGVISKRVYRLGVLLDIPYQ